MPRHPLAILVALLVTACGGASRAPAAGAGGAPAEPSSVTYEVHEWGLVRGTLMDRIAVSGPHVETPPLPVAKPVLYFHRRGEGALVVDVQARIPNGRVVEHWPYTGGVNDVVRWDDVLVQGDACPGSRYPSLGEAPCSGVYDGCEAHALAEVETHDASCVYWPRPPDEDGPTQAWNNLFYRGEITTPPPFPLQGEVLADGRLRLTARGTERVPGRVLRIRRSNGNAGVSDAITVVAPPAPGGSVDVAVPSGPISAGGGELAAALREVGLTQDEIAAFRRAWDATLFGPGVTGRDPAPDNVPMTTTAMPMAGPPQPTTSILYVLPPAAADAFATLSFTPAPTAVHRAMVVWIEETAAR